MDRAKVFAYLEAALAEIGTPMDSDVAQAIGHIEEAMSIFSPCEEDSE